MRIFIIAALFAISYAQTEGFCVERSGCAASNCGLVEKAMYCPCTCNPGTINSNSDHFAETFGADVSSSGSGGDTVAVTDTGATDVTDQAGSGSGGDVTTATDVAPSAPVTFTIARRGYVCEEQDFELFHMAPTFPPRSLQQCAEAVAKQQVCSPMFWSGLVGLQNQCGCVKLGYECAFNEGNDQQAGMNVYMMSPGVMPPAMPGSMPGSGITMPGNMFGGMPGTMPGAQNMQNMFNQGTGASYMNNPKFEAPEPPEAEDILPGYIASMMQQQMQQNGAMQTGGAAPAPYQYPILSKASPQAQAEPKAKGTSPLVWALCFVIPTFVGFFMGAALFRKVSSNSDLRERITV